MTADQLMKAQEVKSKLDNVSVELINVKTLRQNCRSEAYMYPLQLRANVVGEEFYSEIVEKLYDHLAALQDQLKTEFEQL